MNQQTVDVVLKATTVRDDGKRVLACAKAFALAKEHGISLADIGTACNENDIKISSCQLGCFK